MRLLSPISVMIKLFILKPKVVIISTHELLLVASLYKLFSKARIIYDVRENYLENILNTDAFPFWTRSLVGGSVRAKESLTSLWIDHYLLAEKVYQKELPFIGNRFTIVENKCQLPENFRRKPPESEIKILFSGTLSESTGVFNAIKLATQLHHQNPKVHLTIIGFCARSEERKKILKATYRLSFISVKGLHKLVSHQEIFNEISNSTAGIIYYKDAPHLKGRIPTKLYEYLSCRLPILYDESAEWSRLAEQSKAGIPINLNMLNPVRVLSALSQTSFYPEIPKGVTWETEESRFLKSVNPAS